MKAGVFRGPGQFFIEERPQPEAAPGGVLLAVKACAVCGSDLRTLKHGNPRIAPPRVLGHEIAGDVVAVGEGVTSLQVGDRVSTGADVPCGECAPCRQGRPNNCATNLAIGYQWDGGFAEFVHLDARVLAGGPIATFGAALPYAHAALAEPLACCINGFERLPPRPGGEHLLVFGAGPIGLMLAMLGRARHGIERVTVVDPLPARRASAAPFADDVLDSEGCVEAVMDLTDGRGADVIFTANSAPSSHPQAIDCVAVRGVVNLFGGLPKDHGPVPLDTNRIHYREALVTGSHGSTPAQHAAALALIADGVVPVADLISERVSLDELPAAMERARTGEALKVMMQS
ncbi:MAG: alcohol dehydrogenase catalytic domain-containing protein [Deltaproteobacteria bacterium]|nr:alcohol dehydrogenase catalytic domain-containing protein [Deltaproteobacteria bacterium]